MKALNQKELEEWIPKLNELISEAQVQDIYPFANGLVFELYKQGSIFVVLDLRSQSPLLLAFVGGVELKKTKDKPVSLFLRSHLRGMIVDEVSVRREYGRVVEFTARRNLREGSHSEAVTCRLEMHLIPKRVNLLCESSGKKIAWAKPVELEVNEVEYISQDIRSPQDFHEEWVREVSHPKTAQAVDEKAIWERERLKVLSKKRKAMQSIEASLLRLTPEAWSEAGEYLKVFGNREIPEKLLPFVSLKQSLSWNIENCFQESKAAEAKLEGARERQNLLAKEIEELERVSFQPSTKKIQNKKPQELHLTDVKARTLRLDSGLIAYVGKSAQDNLRILRCAKSWDLWLHLRDYPGAHAIIRKNKAQIVSLGDLERVSRWLAVESLGRERAQKMGYTEVVYTEVRFVRPIKGDRLGRVHYQNGQTLNVAIQNKV